MRRLDIPEGCGLLLYPRRRQSEKPKNRVRQQVSTPSLFYNAKRRKQGGTKKEKTMQRKKSKCKGMKGIIGKSVAFLTLLCMTSCYTYTYTTVDPTLELQEAWVGKTYNEIVRTYGAPNRTTPDGTGGSILIYEKTTALTEAGYTNVNVLSGKGTPATRTTTSTSSIQFFVDANNSCYDARTTQKPYQVKGNKEFDRRSTIIVSTFSIVLAAFALVFALFPSGL